MGAPFGLPPTAGHDSVYAACLQVFPQLSPAPQAALAFGCEQFVQPVPQCVTSASEKHGDVVGPQA